ncbi:Ion transport protein [Phytophthora infestans]|uniref:Ion transport protein n=1 Tax=Phytophthora infestans TaxID=4787 RepID=A0A833SVD5_PHYIN|nr:Ion transport protein [Phytophthora infestans]
MTINNRDSRGRNSQQDGRPLPPLRKQRSALATQPGPPTRRVRALIWMAQLYHSYKRPLRFILDPPLLDPRSNEKLRWDALVMFVVLYSAIVVPLQMGFPELTRLIKLRHFVAKVEEAFDLDAVLARLTRLIGQVLLVTHIFSCFWHLIGFTTEDEGTTWMIETDVRNKSVRDRYICSFYWVVATLCGVGYGDVHATNRTERLFSMAVSIVGASGYGLIIGSLTKILENWHRETTTRARKLSMIQAFVRKKRLPRNLKGRLMRYFRHYIAKTSAFDERELLYEFSLSLRGEILHETYRNTFFRIPAFQQLSSLFVLDMAMFIKPLIVIKGDILAREGPTNIPRSC